MGFALKGVRVWGRGEAVGDWRLYERGSETAGGDFKTRPSTTTITSTTSFFHAPATSLYLHTRIISQVSVSIRVFNWLLVLNSASVSSLSVPPFLPLPSFVHAVLPFPFSLSLSFTSLAPQLNTVYFFSVPLSLSLSPLVYVSLPASLL